MTREGVFMFTYTPPNTGAANPVLLGIPDIPMYVSVIDRDGDIEPGQCYASLSLFINGDLLYELCSGIIYSGKSISFPPSFAEHPRPNLGFLDSSALPNAAAGSEISLGTSLVQEWHIIWVRFRLVTSSAVADRRVHLSLQSSAGVNLYCIAGAIQTASQNRL